MRVLLQLVFGEEQEQDGGSIAAGLVAAGASSDDVVPVAWEERVTLWDDVVSGRCRASPWRARGATPAEKRPFAV